MNLLRLRSVVILELLTFILKVRLACSACEELGGVYKSLLRCLALCVLLHGLRVDTFVELDVNISFKMMNLSNRWITVARIEFVLTRELFFNFCGVVFERREIDIRLIA